MEMRCGCTSPPCTWMSNDSDGKYRRYLFWNSMQDRKFPPWKHSVGTHLHPVFGCQTSIDQDGKWQPCAPSDPVLFVDSHPPTPVFHMLLYLHSAGSTIPAANLTRSLIFCRHTEQTASEAQAAAPSPSPLPASRDTDGTGTYRHSRIRRQLHTYPPAFLHHPHCMLPCYPTRAATFLPFSPVFLSEHTRRLGRPKPRSRSPPPSYLSETHIRIATRSSIF